MDERVTRGIYPRALALHHVEQNRGDVPDDAVVSVKDRITIRYPTHECRVDTLIKIVQYHRSKGGNYEHLSSKLCVALALQIRDETSEPCLSLGEVAIFVARPFGHRARNAPQFLKTLQSSR